LANSFQPSRGLTSNWFSGAITLTLCAVIFSHALASIAKPIALYVHTFSTDKSLQASNTTCLPSHEKLQLIPSPTTTLEATFAELSFIVRSAASPTTRHVISSFFLSTSDP